MVIDGEIKRLEEELEYIKKLHKEYGSEFCPENKIRKEKELEDKINELKLVKVEKCS